MKVSLKCLSKFVNIAGLSPEEIASKLTFAGVEVEDISYLARGSNLIIGQIIEQHKHENSDHLHVLKVDLGKEEGVKQIVCGAPNCEAGTKVIVAMEGAKLPGGEIKKSVVRGVESNGMCCSLVELGVDNKFLSEKQLAGIEELPKDAPVGERNVLGYLGLDDVVLSLKVLANRPDLLGIINVAREVGSIFNRKVTIPAFEITTNYKSGFEVGSKTNNCTQFAAKEVLQLKNDQSPKWMKDHLMAMGIRSISALVDIGNYVMLMTGQPLHMYDLDKLPSKSLIVRDDIKGDFVALDEKTYKLESRDITITSNGKVMCLGGVMGALECAVDENTHNIAIESASFQSAAIRKTVNRLGLASESSSRFIKGTNHFQSEYVLDYAAKLISDICSAKQIGETKQYQVEEKQKNVIASSTEEINRRLGTNLTNKEISETLERLNFLIEMNKDGQFKATVPSYRLDVFESADLSEEIIRLLGFGKIESELPNLQVTVGKLNDRSAKSRLASDFLLYNGVDQCLTYTLVAQNELKDFDYLSKDKPHKILNPLTDEREYVRLHILPSLLNSLSYNVARQMKDVRLFEISDILTDKTHSLHLALVLSGDEPIRHKLEKRPVDFYTVKGLFEGLMELLGIATSRYKIEKLISEKEEFHSGKSAVIKIGNEVVGVIGELHPNEIEKRHLGKNNSVAVMELKLDSFFDIKTSNIKMNGISKFPFVKRDIALLLDKEVPVKDLLKTIRQIDRNLIRDCEVFDVYEGIAIGPGRKSVAISIAFQSENRTLKDEEVNELEKKIKSELVAKFKAVLRS